MYIKKCYTFHAFSSRFQDSCGNTDWMGFNAIFNIYGRIVAVNFTGGENRIDRGKPKWPGKTVDLRQVTDELSHTL